MFSFLKFKEFNYNTSVTYMVIYFIRHILVKYFNTGIHNSNHLYYVILKPRAVLVYDKDTELVKNVMI